MAVATEARSKANQVAAAYTSPCCILQAGADFDFRCTRPLALVIADEVERVGFCHRGRVRQHGREQPRHLRGRQFAWVLLLRTCGAYMR